MKNILILLCFICTLRAQIPGVEYVVIIGCDGMSPDGVIKGETPNMDRLMKDGAFTLHARGVMPTSSSPNWASMIMGAGPEQHGVTSNDWQPDKFEIAPTVKGSGGIFPTIYGLLREQKPGIRMGVFHDWGDYGRLFERKAVDVIDDSDGPTNAVRTAIANLRSKNLQFTFIHLDHVDHAGHEFGHGTKEYYDSVQSADQLIGEVLQALEQPPFAGKFIVLVTADHGGVCKKHGNATMAELEIPWIFYGRTVKRGHELAGPVNTFDTAATVAHVFGVKPHPAWIAKPVLEAFEP
jgi:predicted AlkP superfamily pyrophosphatase or phosphodiesterase